MDLNEISVFIKVVQKGSFSGAAAALLMPKSTVSTKVSSLEKRLGVTLLQRSTRKLQLTPVGESFFRRACAGFDELAAAENAVLAASTEPQGRLRITAPVDLGNHILCDLVSDFLRQYPKVTADLLLTDRRVDLIGEGIDLAIRAGELKDSSLIAKKVGEVFFGLFASSRYLKSHPPLFAPKDLVQHDCLLFSSLSTVEWKLHSGKRSVTVPLTGKVVVNDLNLVHRLALMGEGIALLPSFIGPATDRSGKLVRVLPEWGSNISPIHFVYPAQKFVQPVVAAFIEMSTPAMRARFQAHIA